MNNINKLKEEFKLLDFKLEVRSNALQHMRAMVSLAIWRGGDVKNARLATTKKLVRRYAYDTGVMSEKCFEVLCKLDAVDVDGDEGIRAARKSLVLDIKAAIAKGDAARASALRLANFIIRKLPKDVITFESDVEEPHKMEEEAKADQQQTQRMGESEVHVKDDDQEEEESDDEMEEEEAEEEQRAAADEVPMRRWRPRMHQQELADGLRVVLELPGMREDEVEVQVCEGRRLRLQGCCAYGRFEEEFSVGPELDLGRATLKFVGHLCVLSLPYAARKCSPPVRAGTARPAYKTTCNTCPRRTCSTCPLRRRFARPAPTPWSAKRDSAAFTPRSCASEVNRFHQPSRSPAFPFFF